MKILVVEDALYIREHIIEKINSIPGTEIVGETGEYKEALELIENLSPEILILDIRITNGTGIEVLTWVQENKPSVKTIMLTNYPYPQYRKKCIELGARYFLDKSQEFQKLPDIIKEIGSESSYEEINNAD